MFQQPDVHQLNKDEDIIQLRLINFLLLNSDKTEGLVLGPHAAGSKLSDYIGTLCDLSVPSCAALKYFGVLIDSSLWRCR